jgi:hypothetical protein
MRYYKYLCLLCCDKKKKKTYLIVSVVYMKTKIKVGTLRKIRHDEYASLYHIRNMKNF